MSAVLVFVWVKWNVARTMMNWVKIQENFWIVELNNYPKQAREALMQEFTDRKIGLIVLSNEEKQ